MNEIVKPVEQWIAGNIGWAALIAVFIFSLFFEFSKIKLSPITALLRWIGNRITGGLKDDIADLKRDTNEKIADLKNDTNQRIAELRQENSTKFADIELQTELIKRGTSENCEIMKTKLAELEEKQDMQTAARIKNHVLTFSRRCRKGEKHTEEDFRNLIEEHAEYERLVNKYGWTNDVYKEDYAFFLNEYHRCIRDNDFLR